MSKMAVSLAVVVALHGVAAAGTLEQVTGFGSNPGALGMWRYRPTTPSPNTSVVVVMHGCTQTPQQIANSGWSALADEHGFYVVYPEQSSSNNPVKCFNWAGEYGDPANLVRGQGENMSIKQMVDKMLADHDIDPARVFVAGFSSGGAMAAVMMATWPDVFAAGAVMSGIPYRCATSVNGAYNCQALASHPELKKTPAEWGDLVRAAGPTGFTGPWPRLVSFHGTADATVSIDNLTELVDQWTNVHGTDQTVDESGVIGTTTRDRYMDGTTLAVEVYRVGSMGHAVAIGDDPAGVCPATVGSYVEDRDLCASRRALEFFNIVADSPPPPPPPPGTPDAGGGSSGDVSVTITAPADGDTVGGVVTVEADASAADGIARVEFTIDGVAKGSDATAPYTYRWQTGVYDPGDHTVEAIAVDLAARTATSSVTVTIDPAAAGGANLVDPIPCGCAARDGGGGEPAGALLMIGLVAVGLRRRRAV